MHLSLLGFKKKGNRTLLEFLKLFNKAGFLARRHPSKDSCIQKNLQDRARSSFEVGVHAPWRQGQDP